MPYYSSLYLRRLERFLHYAMYMPQKNALYMKKTLDKVFIIMIVYRPMENKRIYPVICSWCMAVVRHSTVENSHSICKVCSEKLIKEYKKTLDKQFKKE